MTDNQYRSIANPRRITLASPSLAAAATPRPEPSALQMMGDDAPVCVDGTCDILD